MDSNAIGKAIEECYTATALAPPSTSYSNTVAQAFGYSVSDLATIPSEANLGLSCGNPLALANLHQGETVIDLGCGAGFDCFLAASKVGDTGRVIGVDMNEHMLAKARENASKAAVHNTSFVSSRITAIDIPDATADVVISNCVINLVPHTEKHSVFKEIFRLLRPGGRLAISDILTKKGLSEQMKTNLALYVGCIAGASRKENYERWLKDAGFSEILVVDSAVDLNVYTQTSDKGIDSAECCGPGTAKEGHASSQESGEYYASKNTAARVIEGMKTRFEDMDLNQWAGSFKIYAVKGA